VPRFKEKTSIDTFENEYLKGLNIHKKLMPFLYGLAKKENISHVQMASALITSAYIILRQKEPEYDAGLYLQACMDKSQKLVEDNRTKQPTIH
jgi:hypothetical protein